MSNRSPRSPLLNRYVPTFLSEWADNRSQELLILFVRMCKWFWKQQSLFWSVIVLNLLLSIVVTLTFTDISTLTKLPIGWAFQNPLIATLTFVAILALTIISRFGSLIPVPLSNRELKQLYLNSMIRETEHITLEGIPASLIAKSEQLDQIFIPMKFWPNLQLTDYPLTDIALEELRHRLQSGTPSDSDVKRVLIEAEKNRKLILHQSDRISIADIWEKLTKESPAAVIQGFPGMGKSTLMERLTLYMARAGLRQSDPDMPERERLRPQLIPVLLHLGRYGDACSKTPDLSLEEYLIRVLKELDIEGVDMFVRQSLDASRVLVMLDGLDEVSNPEKRQQVQEAIRVFIRNRSNSSTNSYNRFLITSRIAGYDQHAFPDYRHFTVAELTDAQIDYFLPRWCRANAMHYAITPSTSKEDQEAIARRVNKQIQELRDAIQGSEAAKELAENPLLLTLLAVMQQNSVLLPRQRVELYSKVTLTLLENRNIVKNLVPIPEKQAIQYLGPLACEMQDKGNSFVRERNVMDSLVKTIGSSSGSPEEVTQEAERFLLRIRERGGLFVQRTGDYFGFSHRTFQEYFAARHMLNAIEQQASQGIEALVSRAVRLKEQWREPFLLAVAYESRVNEKVASDIIRTLLASPYNPDQVSHDHNLLLAAECLIESNPLSIEPSLEASIAQQLLQTYREAQQSQRFEACDAIESVIRRWLLSLPREAFRPSVLLVLHEAIINTNNSALQHATLTLLSMIAQQLEPCPDLVFHTLVPPLLALTGLPATGTYHPSSQVPLASDFDIVDLSLSTLSSLGRRGLAGSLLSDIRVYFQEHPEQLRLLARFSLERRTLLTFIAVPLEDENYQRYEKAIEQWIKLRDSHKASVVTEKEIEACLAIHRDLLHCAETVHYPMTYYLLQMLQASANHPEQPWQQVWQNYLMDQIAVGHYSDYQLCALLWIMLFPARQELQPLVKVILSHYRSNQFPTSRYAKHFLAKLNSSLSNSQFFVNEALRNLDDLRDIKYLQDTRKTAHLYTDKVLQTLQVTRYRANLLEQFLTKEVAQNALKELTSVSSIPNGPTECLDLMVILRERVNQISTGEVLDGDIEHELRQILYVTDLYLTVVDTHETDEFQLNRTQAMATLLAKEAKSVLQAYFTSEQNPEEIISAIDDKDKSFSNYRWLAESIIQRMGIKSNALVETPHFAHGTVWEVTLPSLGLQLSTQRAVLLLRQQEKNIDDYKDLITKAQDNCFIIIMDITDISLSPLPLQTHSRTIWFASEYLKEMVATPPDQLPSWLGRFITAQLDVNVKKSFLPYKTEGAAELFFGREHELTRLTLPDQLGGIIIGAHNSGKSSLLRELGKQLQKQDLKVVGPFELGKIGFQTFFERTLEPLGVVASTDMTYESWASAIRTYRKQETLPIFLLDEVDDIVALDKEMNFGLGRQIRSLHNEDHCKFYFAGHAKLRNAINQEYGPFKNFTKTVLLTGLQETACKHLIQMPMRQIGFKINNEQAQRIFKGTAGVPFLIQDFCIRLLCELSPNQASKAEISDDIIEEIELSPDYLETVFSYYTYAQGWASMCIMLLTAMLGEVTIQDISREFSNRGVVLKRTRLDELLRYLVGFGVLKSILPKEGGQIIRYTVLSEYLCRAIMTRYPESLLDSFLLEESNQEA